MQLPNLNFNWLNKKVIILFIAAILVAEGIWAAKSLIDNKTLSPDIIKSQNKQSPTTPAKAVLSLSSPKSTLKVGEKVTVNINLSSSKPTDGTDIILMYDPRMLSVITNGAENFPIQVGSLYTDYPVNSVDAKVGRVTISGITTKQGGVQVEGLFGSIEFQAKSPGKAKVVFDFTKDSTIDSNVIENKTSQDILDQVNNIEFNIEE